MASHTLPARGATRRDNLRDLAYQAFALHDFGPLVGAFTLAHLCPAFGTGMPDAWKALAS
jgi:hypothetical protein